MKLAEQRSSPSPQADLIDARRALEAKKLDVAADRCRKALAGGQSADALGLMGEIEYRRGNAKAASEWLDKSIALDRRHARSHWVLGNISQDDGKLDRAISSYRRALRAQPGLAEAHNDLGTAYFARGWHQEAEQCYRKALELDPNSASATENLAATLRAQGKIGAARDYFFRTLKLRVGGFLRKMLPARPNSATPETAPPKAATPLKAIQKLIVESKHAEAEKALRAFLEKTPDDPDAHHLLGATLAGLRRRREAIESLERAIALRSSSPEFYVTLGNVLVEERQLTQALERYQTALMLDPGFGAATANIAHILSELGHFREAEEVFRQSLQQEPDLAGAHSSLAGTLISTGKYAEAEAAARTALELNPKLVHGALMLANALLEQGKIDEAEQAIARAAKMAPEDAQLLRWKGVFRMMIHGDFAGAEALLRRARDAAPQDPSIHINLARTLLIRQRFEEGWEEFEWRKRETLRMSVYTKLPYPQWDGEPLEGKAIVVNCEQGLGDEIMYASCLHDIASKARRCVLYCNRRLETLFRRSFPYVEVVAGSHQDPNDAFPILDGIDFQVAAGSLPRFFRRKAADFPAAAAYLAADAAKTAKWRERLDALGPGMKIGLSWKGGTPLSGGTRRSLKLGQFAPLVRTPGTYWVNLQYGDSASEREGFAGAHDVQLHHWQEALDDLDETAALMCALDLRISVCNTQIHIAGALGREVWILTPLSPDSRYGCQGERMLWYPSALMFRQKIAADWSNVLDEVQARLAARLKS